MDPASAEVKDVPSPTEDAQALTPVVGEVSNAPIPFEGSDGRTHLVYELEVTNFSRGETAIKRLEVLDAGTKEVVATLRAKQVASRLQPAGFREPVDSLAPSTTTLVFLHVSFDRADQVPKRLVHRLSVKASAAPPGQQKTTEKLAPTRVNRRDVKVVGPR